MNLAERLASVEGTISLYEREGDGHLPTWSEYVPVMHDDGDRGNGCTMVRVMSEDVVTRIVACAGDARTGVVNFASPVRPGGGWRSGCSAQEESLCRASFLSWELEWFDDEYYGVNREHVLAGMSLPHFVYSHDVKFVKCPVDGREVVVNPVYVDVASMAAPNRRLNDGSYVDADYERDVTYKLKQVLRAFKRYGRETIILGAFGCGVFGNDPRMVARVSMSLLLSDEFAGVFRTVFFSVYGRGEHYMAFVDVLRVVGDARVSGDGLMTCLGAGRV